MWVWRRAICGDAKVAGGDLLVVVVVVEVSASTNFLLYYVAQRLRPLSSAVREGALLHNFFFIQK